MHEFVRSRSFALLFFWIAFAGTSRAQEDTDRLAFLAKANQSALQRLFTIHAHYTRTRRMVWPDRVEHLPLIEHVLWSSRGRLHRVRSFSVNKATGEKSHFSDVFLDNDRTLFLRDYNWESAPSVRRGDRSILGSIRPRGPQITGVNPFADTLLHVRAGSVVQPFSEIIRASHVKSVRDVRVRGRRLVEVDIDYKEQSRRLRIQLDPSVNYLIRRYWRYATERERKLGGVNYLFQVDRFKEIESGVFFPAKTTVTSDRFQTGKTNKNELEFENLRVNAALPDDAFSFQFPENVTVVDKIAGVDHVWGQHAPQETIRSREEGVRLAEKWNLASPVPDERGSLWRVVFWAVNAILVLVAAFFIVKKLRRRMIENKSQL